MGGVIKFFIWLSVSDKEVKQEVEVTFSVRMDRLFKSE